MQSLANVIYSLTNVSEFVIVAWCFLSWIPRSPDGLMNDIAEVLDRLVRPYVSLFSRFIPPVMGMDFSPVVAVLGLQVIQQVLVRLLFAL